MLVRLPVLSYVGGGDGDLASVSWTMMDDVEEESVDDDADGAIRLLISSRRKRSSRPSSASQLMPYGIKVGTPGM